MFDDIVNLIDAHEISANEDLHEDSEAAYEETHGSFTEEEADLIEDTLVERAPNVEETEVQKTDIEHVCKWPNYSWRKFASHNGIYNATQPVHGGLS